MINSLESTKLDLGVQDHSYSLKIVMLDGASFRDAIFIIPQRFTLKSQKLYWLNNLLLMCFCIFYFYIIKVNNHKLLQNYQDEMLWLCDYFVYLIHCMYAMIVAPNEVNCVSAIGVSNKPRNFQMVDFIFFSIQGAIR